MSDTKITRPRRKLRTVYVWAGIVDGKIYVRQMVDGYGKCDELAIFRTRADAARRFEQVTRVEINWREPA